MSSTGIRFFRLLPLFGLAAAMVSLLPREVSAETISHSASFSIVGTNSPSISFAKFDAGLGTLTGISLSFTGTAAGTFSVTGQDPEGTSVNSLTDRLRLIFPSLTSGTFNQAVPNDVTANITPSLPELVDEGETVNFTLSSSPITGVPSADVYTQVGSTAANAYFIGSGNVSASMRQVFGLSAAAETQPTSSYAGVVNNGIATLTYTYAVPEPPTYAMTFAGLACAGFSFWRRRRQA